MKKLSGFQLKIISLVFMCIDHIHTFFGYELGLPRWLHWPGRFVAPVFLYLLMEGFKYTRNRKKYLTRLFLASMFMHLVNIVKNIVTKSYIHPVTHAFDPFALLSGNNIFWTLFLFMVLFLFLDKLTGPEKKGSKKWLLPIAFTIPLLIFSEGGLYLLPIALACFFFDNDPKKVSLSLFVWSILLFIKTMYSYLSYGHEVMSLYQQLTYSSEFLLMTAIPFILAYNGKRGGTGKKWEKNLFYVFYPAHLILLNILSIVVSAR
ncbi:MAG: TraX family protein [Peptoniphilus sp.]|nr:TraX family protein [Peptoniphilus sp.]MDY3118407.1 TraX family protein [Peptoniphilus sp.]